MPDLATPAVLPLSARGRDPGHAHPLLLALAVWLALQAVLIAAGLTPVAHGLLLDTDSYMKMVRIDRLAATGNWFDGHIARSNWPFGETLHWTRLFDIVVIAGAVPLTPFLPLHDALFWSGAFISPVLQFATLAVFIWAARPILGGPAKSILAVAGLLAVTQPAILSYALPGRADHHLMLLLLYAAMIGGTLHALKRGTSDAATATRAAALAGIAAGLGIWGSVELMITAATLAVALGLAWLIEGRAWLRINRAYAVCFFMVAAAGLLIERPLRELAASDGDRISLMHVAAAGALCATWFIIGVATARCAPLGRAWRARLVLCAVVAAAAGGLLVLGFPALAGDPMAAVDPRIRPIWLDKVAEMQPLWPATREATANLVLWLGTGFVAMPWLGWLLVARRHHPAFLARLGLAVAMIVMVPVALDFQRFAPYAELLFGLALADLLRALVARAQTIAAPAGRALLRTVPVIAIFLLPLVAGTRLQPHDAGARLAAAGSTICTVRDLAAELPALDPSGRTRPLTILASIDLGPELLYRTRDRVVGTPYHRNGAGIYDTYAALTGNAATAKRIVDARRVDLVLLCPNESERNFFADGGKDSLYARLLRGALPAWLRAVPLPAGLARQFKLFRVVGR